MKILVTGGTGFTGSHLVRRLLAQGHEVIALDYQRGIFYDELEQEGAQVILGSVADRETVFAAVKGCEVVHHLAAAFRSVNLPKQEYWNINVEGTRHVLDAALEYGVRKVVYCSTCGVHGNVDRIPSGEDSPIAPADYYQLTKWEGERLIPDYVAKGLRVLTLRPAAIYGPGDPERFAMIFKRSENGSFLMAGNGKTYYHPLYIDNLIDAFLLAANSDRGDGEAYLIADERPCTLNELVHGAGEAMGIDVTIRYVPFWPVWLVALATEIAYLPLRGVNPPLFRRRVDWFRQNRGFDISKARNELGFEPRVGLAEGLKRTADWYREVGIIGGKSALAKATSIAGQQR